MSDAKNKTSSEADGELEREIRNERKFTLAEAIGRLAGPGAMKGASPVPRGEQAGMEIGSWLRSHLADSSGALEVALHRQVTGSDIMLANFDRPLAALAGYCQRLLESDALLEELVREADIEWGRTMYERPHFEIQGSSPHPDDPYTFASVRNTLSRIVKELASEG
jgi:hypothetical protein